MALRRYGRAPFRPSPKNKLRFYDSMDAPWEPACPLMLCELQFDIKLTIQNR